MGVTFRLMRPLAAPHCRKNTRVFGQCQPKLSVFQKTDQHTALQQKSLQRKIHLRRENFCPGTQDPASDSAEAPHA
jgi:hypothetical protein